LGKGGGLGREAVERRGGDPMDTVYLVVIGLLALTVLLQGAWIDGAKSASSRASTHIYMEERYSGSGFEDDFLAFSILFLLVALALNFIV
jgi:preprotein translocase subunit SecG